MAPPMVVPPKCPHCSADLTAVSLFNWQAGAWGILCVYCGSCKKSLDFQVVPLAALGADPRLGEPS